MTGCLSMRLFIHHCRDTFFFLVCLQRLQNVCIRIGTSRRKRNDVNGRRDKKREQCLQGRLIPGTSVASVPFIDELRTKMLTSGWKEDGVPDECFKRLRGALFVGPSWSVTRNKLKLRYVCLHSFLNPRMVP